MGGYLKLAGWGFGGLGALVLAGLLAAMILNDDYSQAAGLIIPLLFLGAGVGLWKLGNNAEADAGFDLPHIAKWVFMSVGAVMVIGGVILSFDEPGALFLIFMGAVFCAAGWFAGSVMATPEGKKKVFVEQTSGVVRHAVGGDATVTSGAYIEVDEDATEDEVRAAVSGWRDAMLDDRPDWRTGCIRSNTPRIGALWFIPIAMIAVGLGLSVIGWLGDGFLLYFGGIPVLVGLFFLWTMFRRWRQLRIFGESILAMKRSPIAPGDRLEAELETAAPRRAFADGRFTLTVDCIRRTRSEGANDRVTYDDETLWSHQRSVTASGEAALQVQVRFDLPSDLPGATLTRAAAAQIRWSLRAEAAGRQALFRETFDLPVLGPTGD